MIREGERVLLVDPRGKKWLVKVGTVLETDLGKVDTSQLVGKDYGTRILSHTGHEFLATRPSLYDLIRKLPRASTPIPEKDIGYVITRTGMERGWTIVDAGTGSGIAAAWFAKFVHPGRVYTYEIREEFARIAKRNFERLGLDNVVLKMKNIRDGIDERNVDMVHLDLPRPVEILSHAEEALRSGGWLVVYTPYLEDMIEVQRALKEMEFFDIESVEIILRYIDVKRSGSRHKLTAPHSGYLTFARRK